MKLTIERAGNGFIIDATEREKWKPEINLPWLVTTGESGDDTDTMLDLLCSIRDIFDSKVKLTIERIKDE